MKRVGGYVLDQLTCLGQGTQGRVYRIDEQRCIKIFKKKKVCQKELETLNMAQGNSHFPRLYEGGENYIIREYIKGIELDQYLKDHPLTIALSKKILEVYHAIGKVGFARQDSTLFHIFVTPQGNLRVIDTARVMKEKTTYPRLLLKGLQELGYKEEFLIHISLLDPRSYKSWMQQNK